MTNPAGKSDWFFYFTSDNQFIIKSIKKEEKQVMLGRFLRDYFFKLRESLLARIYGLYELTIGCEEPLTFILMGNIALPAVDIIA